MVVLHPLRGGHIQLDEVSNVQQPVLCGCWRRWAATGMAPDSWCQVLRASLTLSGDEARHRSSAMIPAKIAHLLCLVDVPLCATTLHCILHVTPCCPSVGTSSAVVVAAVAVGSGGHLPTAFAFYSFLEAQGGPNGPMGGLTSGMSPMHLAVSASHTVALQFEYEHVIQGLKALAYRNKNMSCSRLSAPLHHALRLSFRDGPRLS